MGDGPYQLGRGITRRVRFGNNNGDVHVPFGFRHHPLQRWNFLHRTAAQALPSRRRWRWVRLLLAAAPALHAAAATALR